MNRNALFGEKDIALQVARLAREIAARKPRIDIAVPVLTGAFIFAADLLRALSREGLDVEQADNLTYRIRFDRTKIATADLIRRILTLVEVRDLLIEDEPIEEIIKRIYAGESSLSEIRA